MTITAKLMRESGAVANNFDRQSTATEVYLVEQDTGANISGYSEIVATGLLPKFGTRYTGTSAVCSRYEARPEEGNRSIWYVTVYYETRNSDFSSTNSDDPIKQPARVWYGLRKYTEVAEFAYKAGDKRGEPTDPVQNTAQDRFSPMPTVEKHQLVVYVEKNYRSFDPGDIAFYQNTINVGPVTIGGVKFEKDEAWLSKVSHRLMFDDDGDPYDRMHFEIVKRDGGWKTRIASNGFRYRTLSGKLENIREWNLDLTKPITKANSVMISTPAGLDSDGAPAAGTLNDVAIQTFRFKWREDWSKLDLPVKKNGRR